MGMEYRPYYIGQEWLKMGHNVYIIAADNAHVRTKQINIAKSLESENIDGLNYIWIKTPKYKGNSVFRILNMLSFVRKLKIHSKKIAKTTKPDLVIASSTYPMDNYAAYKIAKKAKAKYAYEVHDLWPLSPMEFGGYSKNHPFIMYVQKAEDFAYKHCDYVISMLPKTKEYMISRGMAEHKWHYVPNGINIKEWENTKPLNEKIKNEINEIRARYKTIIAYTGSIGIANALDTFIESAKDKSNEDIAFVLVGKGPEKERLKKISENQKNIFFIDPTPKQEMPDLLSYFDILYIGLQNQSLLKYGISPNKIFDYMMSSKPIIQAINAGNDIVSEANCGISIDAENSAELNKAIKKMLSFSEEEITKLGQNGKNYVVKHHDYRVLAKKIIEIVNE